MSCLYKGSVIDTDLSRNSRGGTEQMRDRVLKYVDKDLLAGVAIHFSRPEKLYPDVPNILYCHDLAEDPAVNSLLTDADQYDYFVFVSYWQRDQFISRFALPYSKCIVIQNAIEKQYDAGLEKPTDKIRFIYHTTPHRGLELVYPIFDRLSQLYDNIHLDVFSSFSIYGWEQRDAPYHGLFEKIKSHPHMTYHGAKTNDEVFSALEKAHVFLYPSIWKETSCIALIEAITAGCLCVYPSYGALSETGSMSSNICMYEYSENTYENASTAFEFCDWILSSEKNATGFISAISRHYTKNSGIHSIESFKTDWNSLIKKILERKAHDNRT